MKSSIVPNERDWYRPCRTSQVVIKKPDFLGMQTWWKALWSFLKKLKTELPYHTTEYPQNTRTVIQRETCPPVFISALFTITILWKQSKCPSFGKWIKMWLIYTMEYYSVIKKNEILPFTMTWIEPESIILNEISPSEKDKYHMISLICVIQKTKKISKGKK